MSQFIGRINEAPHHKGPCFYLNIVALGTFLVLAVQELRTILGPQSHASAKRLAILIAATLICAAAVFLAIRCRRVFNRYLLASLLIIYCAFESTLRYTQGRKPFSNSGMLFRYPKPYVMFTGKPNSRITAKAARLMGGPAVEADIVMNDLGFRGPAPAADRRDEEFVIIMVGGSTTFNGSPLSNSVPLQLQAVFQDNGFENLRVYNFGVVSFVSGQELSLMLHTITDLKPDLVVSFGGVNDAWEPFYYDPRPGYPYNHMAWEQAVRTRGNRDAPVGDLVTQILRKSRVAHRFFWHSFTNRATNLHRLRQEVNHLSGPWRDQIAEIYINNLRKMCNLARAFEFRFVAFLQPNIHFKNNLIGAEQTVTPLNGEAEHFRETFQLYLQKGEDLWQESPVSADCDSCAFVDISRMFENSERQIFPDGYHATNEGNRMIAEQMFGRLREWVGKLYEQRGLHEVKPRKRRLAGYGAGHDTTDD